MTSKTRATLINITENFRQSAFCIKTILQRVLEAGRLFPSEPVNFIHRKWSISQEISQNISKVVTNLTYLNHLEDEKSLEFQQICTFDVISFV